MASVRMVKVAAGPSGCFGIGAVREVSPEEGAALVRAGAAEWVEVPVRAIPVQTATLPPAENAAVKMKRKGKRG